MADSLTKHITQIPIYFLPGTQCDEQLWQQVFELLPNHFTPHAIVLPHGETPLEIVHALHQQLIQYQPTSLNLVGFSLGGYLASLYATTYPEHLHKLFILANAPRSLPNHELTLRVQTLSYVNTYGYKGMPKKRIEQLLADSNKNNTNIVNTISAMDKRGGQKMLEQQLTTTSKREDLISQLITLPFDIKFVIGEEDNLVNIEQLTQELTVNSKEVSCDISVDLIKDCGHMSPLESPQAVAKHLITFFNERVKEN